MIDCCRHQSAINSTNDSVSYSNTVVRSNIIVCFVHVRILKEIGIEMFFAAHTFFYRKVMKSCEGTDKFRYSWRLENFRLRQALKSRFQQSIVIDIVLQHRARRFHPVTTLLRELKWLSIKSRIEFRLGTIDYLELEQSIAPLHDLSACFVSCIIPYLCCC